MVRRRTPTTRWRATGRWSTRNARAGGLPGDRARRALAPTRIDRSHRPRQIRSLPACRRTGALRLLRSRSVPARSHDHLATHRVEVDAATREQLRATGADVSDTDIAEASRDWWPLAMIWALDAQVAARASVVVTPHDVGEVQAVLRLCNDARIPVTAAAGRSGVCGASVPVFGGVLLDLTGLTGIVGVDTTSLLVDVRAGTFGDVFEDELREQSRRDLRALAAVDGAVDRRRLGGVPRRGPAVDPLREDRGHRRGSRRRARRRHAHRDGRRAPRRGRPRPDAAVPRLGGNARHRRRRPPARASPPHAPKCAARTRSRRSPTASTRCGASSSGAPLRPCCACTTPPRPTAATTPAPCTCC